MTDYTSTTERLSEWFDNEVVHPMEDFHTVVEDMHHGTLARGVLTF